MITEYFLVEEEKKCEKNKIKWIEDAVSIYMWKYVYKANKFLPKKKKIDYD